MHPSPGSGSSRLVAAAAVVLLGLALGGSGATLAWQRGNPENIGGVPEEKPFKEDALNLPAYPDDAGLIEFRPRGHSENRFYVDRNSVSLGADWVVRYTAVVKSPSGATNISYEALRCKTAEYKVYAYGARNGTWTTARETKWQGVDGTTNNFRYSLRVDYLCDSEAVAGRNAKELIAKLKGDRLNNFDLKER
ncbi:MAG TPA: CNP1-like family protein [Burkholderiales bacterium]|nr:CNP1-like family protein [Burkholderiales bacterium]